MDKMRAHIFVQGRVQGVFFRQAMKKKAQDLGIFGWVRNLPDGKVEAVLEGDKERIDRIIEWVKLGPALADVERVEIVWEEYKNEFVSFDIE